VTDIATKRYRALFISDVHLGTRGCQADKLLDFLRLHDADIVYLVGDIVDGWALRSSWYWPQAHNDVVQKLLRKARKGARLIYIPGNHDEFLRGYYGTHFGGIEVVEHTVHETATGKRYLVVHGDIFDLVVTQARWLALLGDKAYEIALTANRLFNILRRVLGAPYWSLSQWAKLKVKNAVNFIGAFEKALATEAKHHGISMGEMIRIVRQLEGTVDPASEPDGSEIGVKVLRPIWHDMQQQMMARFDNLTIEELCDMAREKGIASEARQITDFSI